MLALLPVLALLAPLAYAQNETSATASAVDIEGLVANFQQAELTPQLLETFSPEALLSVAFSDEEITPGANLTQDSVGSSPTLSVSPSSNATFEEGTLYTIIMVDADVVGTDESTTQQTRHWLVNSASLATGSDAPYAVNWTGSTSITDYAGPGPDAGSGSHRYVIAVYEQPSDFAAPSDLSAAGTALGKMSLSSYVTDSKLGNLITANYFQVENGVATATPSSTTAVDSTTLAGYGSTSAAASDASGTSTGSASGAASSAASGATSAGSAASSAATSAASTGGAASAAGRTEMGWGAVVGAVGVLGAVVGAGMV
ncbi:hypothetical protein IAT38_003132 [Cryptococcus sp. DSM 104549]